MSYPVYQGRLDHAAEPLPSTGLPQAVWHTKSKALFLGCHEDYMLGQADNGAPLNGRGTASLLCDTMLLRHACRCAQGMWAQTLTRFWGAGRALNSLVVSLLTHIHLCTSAWLLFFNTVSGRGASPGATRFGGSEPLRRRCARLRQQPRNRRG